MPLSQPPQARVVPTELLSGFTALDVLYEAEAPVVFMATTGLGQKLIAYGADEDTSGGWIILAPCSARTIEDLREGRIAVREALTTSWLWLARRDRDRNIPEAWAVGPEDLPPQYLPSAGTPLELDHESMLSTRAIGPGIAPGSLPASVVAYVADAPRKAINALLDHLLQRRGEGRPPEALRALSDLPVNRFVFASFEMDFGAPASLLEREDVHRAAELLQRGLAWSGGRLGRTAGCFIRPGTRRDPESGAPTHSTVDRPDRGNPGRRSVDDPRACAAEPRFQATRSCRDPTATDRAGGATGGPDRRGRQGQPHVHFAEPGIRRGPLHLRRGNARRRDGLLRRGPLGGRGRDRTWRLALLGCGRLPGCARIARPGRTRGVGDVSQTRLSIDPASFRGASNTP
jgi:hypothetical protein